MIEAPTKDFKAHAEFCPLYVAKGFSQAVAAIVSRQIDGFTPRFDHTVDYHSGEGSGSLAGLEKVVIVLRVLGDEEVT